MDFIKDFETDPSFNKFNSFKKQDLIDLAEYFEVAITKTTSRQMIKSELLKVLNERGLLTHGVSAEVTGAQSSESELRFRELEVEMRRLELRERELNYEKELKAKQMEFEYRKMVLEKELQLKEIESQRKHAKVAKRCVVIITAVCINGKSSRRVCFYGS